MNLDRHILKLLKKRGSNLHKPHAIEFCVYFKGRSTASKARSLLRKKGFHVELLTDTSGKRWICLSIKEMFPRYEAIQKVKTLLNKLAGPLGGHCDGWGTQIEK